jgi:hypothetical protein
MSPKPHRRNTHDERGESTYDWLNDTGTHTPNVKTRIVNANSPEANVEALMIEGSNPYSSAELTVFPPASQPSAEVYMQELMAEVEQLIKDEHFEP